MKQEPDPKLCRACGHPGGHDSAAVSAECWAGKARMAHAKQAAGGDWFPETVTVDGAIRTVWRFRDTELDDVEREAVRRHLVPVKLTEHGYTEVPA